MASRLFVITTPRIVTGEFPKGLHPSDLKRVPAVNECFIKHSKADLAEVPGFRHFGVVEKSDRAWTITTYGRQGPKEDDVILTSCGCFDDSGAFVLAMEVPDAVLLMERPVFDDFEKNCKDVGVHVQSHHCNVELAKRYLDAA